jgi:lysophospholipase L1-like esterase
MIRSITLRHLAASLLALFTLGAVSQVQAQTPVRIMPLGDSITAGPGCWRAYLWGQLQTAGYTNIDFVGSTSDGGGCNPGFAYDQNHEGHSGFSVTGIADGNQLPPWLSAAQPDIIVMHLGTNDMWGGWIPLETKVTALTKLIGQMRAYKANIKLVAAQIIPMNADGCTTCMSDVIAFNSALANLAANLSTTQSPIYVVDQWTGFDVVADTYDRVHPVTSGFIKMANKFYPAVAQALNGGTTPSFTLGVSKSGAGAGTVTSAPSGINCGTSCTASYVSGTSVSLTASPASGSTFAGWSGACSGTGTCTVSMSQARSVSATFNSTTTTFALIVTKSGSGSGTVTSAPSGINCGSVCSANYSSGTSVTLTAAAAGGSTFAGWGGVCSGTGTCTTSLTQARAVTATFNTSSTPNFTLTVGKSGAGTGVVTSSPSAISCGSTCSASFSSGTSVTLTASAASNSAFAGWSGACMGTGACAVSMTQARSVTATFNAAATFALTVTKTGSGAGTVVSSPSGINCGSICNANYGGNASVALTATADSGSAFAGWSGACSGTGSCVLTMNQARSVTATFNTSGGTGGTCQNPVTFTGNSGNFNTTGAVCYRTNATVNGWGCYNFDGRTLTIGGIARTCGQTPLTRSADGYYYFSVTAGQFPWAGLFTW